MSRRYTDTNKWEDPWYLSLNNEHKLVWIYVIDRCDHVGIYKHSQKLMAFHTGVDVNLSELSEILTDRFIPISDEKVFIPRFVKFQYPKGLGSKKPLIVSVRSKLTELNLLAIIEERYGNDYVMIRESLPNDSFTIKGKGKGKEIKKGKECEERKTAKELIKHFNKVTGQNRRCVDGNLKPIISRLNDGFTVDDAINVIDGKHNEWCNDPDMSKHITIETLFRPSNFEKYLNQPNYNPRSQGDDDWFVPSNEPEPPPTPEPPPEPVIPPPTAGMIIPPPPPPTYGNTQ